MARCGSRGSCWTVRNARAGSQYPGECKIDSGAPASAAGRWCCGYNNRARGACAAFAHVPRRAGHRSRARAGRWDATLGREHAAPAGPRSGTGPGRHRAGIAELGGLVVRGRPTGGRRRREWVPGHRSPESGRTTPKIERDITVLVRAIVSFILGAPCPIGWQCHGRCHGSTTLATAL